LANLQRQAPLSKGKCKVNWGGPNENPVPFEAEKAAGIEHVNGVVPPTPEWYTAEARKCLPLLHCKGDSKDPETGKEVTCSVHLAAAGHDIEYLWVQDVDFKVLGRTQKLDPSKPPLLKFELPADVKTLFAFSKSAAGVWRSQPHFKMSYPGKTEFSWAPESDSLDLRWTVPHGYNHTFDVVEGYIPKPEGWLHPADPNNTSPITHLEGAA